MAIFHTIAGMSPAGKSATGAGASGVLLTVVGVITGAWVYIAYIAAALLVAVVLVVCFRLFLKWRQKGKSAPFIGRLLGTTSGSPATADPAMRAKLDDLRKRFEEGIEKYRGAGKDVYSLPWVLMAGPSGSGKTEAIRHCNVGFPPGLQDPLQGTGGTHNMNWWFMNPAVVLDTAGRLFMEEGGSEWKELMKLLKSWRPLQPINGMILAIGVDSLIKDSAEKIEMEASKVARQLDAITRDLDVRFPVYIWVTKCDLLIGFREYFSTISDPQLQHQMLGWSNPADLDEPFQADRVTEHLEQVVRRLMRRRGALLSDPTPQNMQAVSPRRIDEVDALYALPESLMSIGSRLRRYLELIFVQGEWSAKPLFLRGIYFTSALQEGAELDEAIARAMGVPVDALPGGSTFTNTKKSYFLRDVLMTKVFPEKGLVTRATNVKQQQRGRKLGLLVSGIAVVTLSIVFTVFGYLSLAKTVSDPATFWDRVYRSITSADAPFAVVRESEPGKIEVNNAEVRSAPWSSPAQMLSKTSDQTLPANAVRPPAIFKALALALPESLQDRVGQAHEAVTDLSLVRPLVQAARKRFSAAPDSVDWVAGDNAAVKVLASLVQFERSTADGKPHGKIVFPVADYLRVTASPDEQKKLTDAEQARLKEVVEQAVEATGAWPPPGLKASTDPKAVESASAAFNAHWPARLAGDPKVGVLLRLQSALADFDAADKALMALAKTYETSAPTDQRQYDDFRAQWDARYAELTKAWKTIELGLTSVNVKEIDGSVAKAGESFAKTIDESYRLVLGMTGASAAVDALAGVAAKAEGDKKDDAKQVADLAGKAADAMRFSGDPAALQPSLRSMYDTWQQLKSPSGPVLASLAKLKEFYGSGGRGSVLLAEVSGDPAIKTVVAARYDVYRQVGDMFAAPPPAIAWGELKTDKSMSLRSAIDAVESELASRGTLVDQRSKMAVEPGADAAGALKRTGDTGLRIAAMGRRTAALDLALAARQGPDPKWLKDRVEAVVAQIALAPSADPSAPQPSASEITLPPPFSPTSFKLDRGYDPAGAKRILDDGATVMQLAGLGPADAKATAAATPLVIDPRQRAGAAREAVEAVRAYARLYYQDWTSKPSLAMSGVADKTWADYRKSLESSVKPSQGSINSRLEAFGSIMQQALRAIPAEFDPDLATSQGQSRIAWLEALKNDGDARLADSRRASMDNWLKLNDNPQKALSDLAPISSGDLMGVYFADYAGAGGNSRLSTPATRYWDQLRLQCLTLLVNDIRSSVGDLFDSLDKMRTLPLAVEPPPAWQGESSQASGMPAPRVALTAQNLVALSDAGPSRASANRGKSIASGDRPSPPIESISRELDRLFGGNKILEDTRAAALIRSWTTWLPLFADPADPIKVTIYVLPGLATKDPAAAAEAEGYLSMAGTVNNFALTVAGRSADKPQNTAAAGNDGVKLGAEFPINSPDVKIEFYDYEDSSARKVSGGRKLVSGWSALELLADVNTKPWGNDSQGKRWMVPVRYNGMYNGTPTKLYMWIGIELSKPLPPQNQWPGPGMWK